MFNTSLLWIGLPIALGFALFHLKYKVQMGEEELRGIHQDIKNTYSDLLVLDSEWASLNNPVALSKLNQTYFKLEPLKVPQITTFQNLPSKTPQEREEKVQQNNE
jgi:hypothetical protein